jgi:hypothetical protein
VLVFVTLLEDKLVEVFQLWVGDWGLNREEDEVELDRE